MQEARFENDKNMIHALNPGCMNMLQAECHSSGWKLCVKVSSVKATYSVTACEWQKLCDKVSSVKATSSDTACEWQKL